MWQASTGKWVYFLPTGPLTQITKQHTFSFSFGVFKPCRHFHTYLPMFWYIHLQIPFGWDLYPQNYLMLFRNSAGPSVIKIPSGLSCLYFKRRVFIMGKLSLLLLPVKDSNPAGEPSGTFSNSRGSYFPQDLVETKTEFHGKWILDFRSSVGPKPDSVSLCRF